jgi:hypothetical protein
MVIDDRETFTAQNWDRSQESFTTYYHPINIKSPYSSHSSFSHDVVNNIIISMHMITESDAQILINRLEKEPNRGSDSVEVTVVHGI